jgi:hypothetical protein
VLALARSERLFAVCATAVAASSAALPSPRFVRAVDADARSDRLFAFCAADAVAAAAAPAVSNAVVDWVAADPSPRFVLAVAADDRSERLLAFTAARPSAVVALAVSAVSAEPSAAAPIPDSIFCKAAAIIGVVVLGESFQPPG